MMGFRKSIFLSIIIACAGNFCALTAAQGDGCSAGKYVNDDNTECLVCEKGYRCVNGKKYKCGSGYYSDIEGASTCSLCYGPNVGIEHTLADIGEESLNIGCKQCQDGTYGNQGVCSECPVGHWCVDGYDKGVCPDTKCASISGGGCANNNGGATQCITCPDGQYGIGGVCYDCPRGHWCKNGEDKGPGSAGTCVAIDGVCTNGGGATGVKNCTSEGLYSNEQGTDCVSCNNARLYYKAGVCYDCPDIEYDDILYERVRIDGKTGSEMCGLKLKLSASKCDSGTDIKWYNSKGEWKLLDGSVAYAGTQAFVKSVHPSSPDGENADWCEKCEDGTFYISGDTGLGACVACPAGYCKNDDECLPCKPGYFCPGDETGGARECHRQESLGGIKYGIVCLSDTYDCENETKCPKGSFSAKGQAKCTACATGYTTDGIGTSYVNDNEHSLNTICKKIKTKFKIGNQSAELPACLIERRINKRFVSQNN